MMDLSINTNSSSSSPKGWRYVLLTSPKSKLKLSPLNLPFLMIFLGVGFLLGGTMWNNTISEQRHIETNKDMTVSGSIREQQKDHHVTPVDGRKGSLPLCWLMSFPVSNVLCDLYLGHVISNQQPSQNSGTSYTSLLVRTRERQLSVDDNSTTLIYNYLISVLHP